MKPVTAIIAPENPKAVVVLVHGMAEHKERYYPFMNFLSDHGFACVIYDQRGHGETATSRDELGYFGPQGPDALIEDCAQMVREAREAYPGLKLFLFGHSMGSMVVRCFLKKYDALIDGLIVCGSPSKTPGTGLLIAITQIMRLFKGDRFRSKKVAMLMFGAHEKKYPKAGMHNAWLSANIENVQAYNADSLCGFRFTLNGYRSVLQLLRRTYEPKGWQVQNADLPIHFVAGSDDPCIISLEKFAQAVSFLRGRGYGQVTSKVYPLMRHEILNETERYSVFQDLTDVLNSWL